VEEFRWVTPFRNEDLDQSGNKIKERGKSHFMDLALDKSTDREAK